MRASNSLPEWSKEEINGGGECIPLRIMYQRSKHYLESPNPVEVAELERASLNTLFFSASSTLFLLSFISLRSVWTCLLIACHTAFDARSSDVEIPEASGWTGFALCV